MNEERILKAIEDIKTHLKEGWSSQIAVKKACGSPANNLAKAVRLHPHYVEVLNEYMGKHLSPFKFEIRDDKLVPKKGRYGA